MKTLDYKYFSPTLHKQVDVEEFIKNRRRKNTPESRVLSVKLQSGFLKEDAQEDLCHPSTDLKSVAKRQSADLSRVKC
jgi:protein associated with RNAse G/E